MELNDVDGEGVSCQAFVFEDYGEGADKDGSGRYMVGYCFMRTAGHAIFRFRPLLSGGWFMEWIRNKSS